MVKKHFFNTFPTFDLDDIVLREIQESDALDYYNYMTHNLMESYLTDETRPRSIKQALDEVQYWSGVFIQKKSIYWAISFKEANKIIGSIGFNDILFCKETAEISYDLNPNYWSKGIMRKSINKILEFSDSVLRLKKIQATVVIHNTRSISLLSKSGFEREAIIKNYEIINGEYKDYYLYVRKN